MRIHRPVTIALFLSILALGFSEAGAQTYSLEVTSANGDSGTDQTVSVLLDNDAAQGGQPLDGWSFGLCSDSTELTPVSAVLGAAAAPLNPSFANIDLNVPGGITVGVIISFSTTTTLAPGFDLELLTATYTLIAPAGTAASVAPCSTIGSPPVEALVVAGPSEITPAMIAGTITANSPQPTATFTCAHVTPIAGVATLPITLTHDNSSGAAGFSFGLAFNDVDLVPQSLTVGTDLAAIRAGSGPAFFGANLTPSGGGGVILGVLNDFNQPPAVLPIGTDLEVAVLAVTIAPTATPGALYPVDFSAQIGSPPTVLEVATRVGSTNVSITPAVVSGSVDLAVSFMRGDANGDGLVSLGDVISSLEQMFTSQTGPDCPDELDVNDDGSLGILDVVFLLEYLFTSGAAPAAPFPTCGPDTSGDDPLGCNGTAASCP